MKIEAAEQYSRRNCLLFQVISFENKESTDDKVKQFARNHLNIDIRNEEIDQP